MTTTATTIPDTSGWLTLCDNDEDVFLIEASADKMINARIEFVHADGDLDLILWGVDGTQILAASDSTNNYEEINVAAPVAGTYYLRVFSLANDISSRYTLSVQLE